VRHGLDLLVVAAAIEAALMTATRDDLVHPSGLVHWFEVGAITAAVLFLLARRKLPFAAPATTFLASAALSFLDGQLIANEAGVFLAGMGAAVLLGNQRRGAQAHLGLVVVLVAAAVVTLNQAAAGPGEVISIAALFGIGWVVGYALRERTERTEAAEDRARRAEAERETAARLAVAEERARIARELHDVVAHAVSVIVLQVGAVRHRLPTEAVADREALANVEQAGRTALTEMRRLLGAMRDEGEAAELTPHPGLDDLGHLVEEVRGTGLGVHLTVRGQPVALPRGLDLSAYRIVQEGLTNSLKHSGAGTAAKVTVEYRRADLVLEVRDDGPGVHGDRRAGLDGAGHGLVGIRERVKLFGGDLAAGPAPGGGFLLRARLPLEGGPT
jgi:signal transduction histidine kinase